MNWNLAFKMYHVVMNSMIYLTSVLFPMMTKFMILVVSNGDTRGHKEIS